MIKRTIQFLSLIMLLPLAFSSYGQIEKYIAGTHYAELRVPVNTKDSTKIEVIEAFWYGCSHCFRFEPLIVNWEANQAEDVDFHRFPAMWNDLMKIHGQVYYTAEALDAVEVLHERVFSAINVEGNRLPMSMGDLILTPNWTWHDHHNEGDSHVIWYDGLDVLMAYWIGGVFFEQMVDVTGEKYQAIKHEVNAVTDNFGPGMVHHKKMYPDHIPASNNPLIYYPYSKARALLANLAEQDAGDSHEDIVIEYVNPVTCGPTFPTMGTSLRLIKEKSTVAAMHRTENILFITMEGSVTFHTPNNDQFTTKPHDVTAMPSWVPYRITNDGDTPAVLFSQTDRPVFEALGFYREQKT